MPKQVRVIEVDMNAVDSELGSRHLNPNRFARLAGIDTALAYKVIRRQMEPTNAFILGLAAIGIDLDAVRRQPVQRAEDAMETSASTSTGPDTAAV